MIIIEEMKKGNSHYYKVSKYSKDNRLLSIQIVKYTLKSVVCNKTKCFMLFDSNGRCIIDYFKFINMYKVYTAETSREKYAFYLRYLYEFSAVINKDISKFQRKDIDKLIVFLIGYDPNSSIADSYFAYSRKSEDTVAAIFNVIKEYVEFCGFASFKYFKNFKRVKKRVISKSKQNALCPKFISLREMNLILNYIKQDNSLDEETKRKYSLIYKLMFNKGLRIGEVLGLTLEDFEQLINNDGEIYYRVYIRNRISDSKDQRAKRCVAMDGQYSYNSPIYHRLDIGYQQVFISEDTYNEIIEYFDLMSARFKKENKPLFKADAVESLNDNWYIFNNKKRPTPLNKDVLYDYTRNMFKKLNIHIDKYIRTNNLFHRFRHGYCMYLLYVEKIPPIEACRLTRHRNMESLAVYNNPTEEMIDEMMIKVEEGTEFYEY